MLYMPSDSGSHSTEQPLIALVDCNNFYVSCERIFRPDLLYKPVAVLSNNDGCIVSRSQEVKRMGIKMAVPVYQIQHLIKKHQIHLFSSNYALYADMSSRVMRCLETYAPDLEIYSIDESFLNLSGVCNKQSFAYGLMIKRQVYKNTGIPVCVGMGPTKTLAKLANYAAKKWPKTQGVVDLTNTVRREKLMRLVPVNEVWGIGRQTTKKLQRLGIYNVYDLARQPAEVMQAQFNIMVARTVMELNGIHCIALDDVSADKQQIVCSRSFKRRLTEYQELAQALSRFATRATEKLRQQHAVSRSISVFIQTSMLNSDEPQYQRSIHSQLNQPTSDTRHIAGAAKKLLGEIFKPGYRYQKCGIQLAQIRPQSQFKQTDLFDDMASDTVKSDILMATVDDINRRFPGGVNISSSVANQWQTPVQYLSSRYTTSWNQLAVARC